MLSSNKGEFLPYPDTARLRVALKKTGYYVIAILETPTPGQQLYL